MEVFRDLIEIHSTLTYTHRAQSEMPGVGENGGRDAVGVTAAGPMICAIQDPDADV